MLNPRIPPPLCLPALPGYCKPNPIIPDRPNLQIHHSSLKIAIIPPGSRELGATGSDFLLSINRWININGQNNKIYFPCEQYMGEHI